MACTWIERARTHVHPRLPHRDGLALDDEPQGRGIVLPQAVLLHLLLQAHQLLQHGRLQRDLPQVVAAGEEPRIQDRGVPRLSVAPAQRCWQRADDKGSSPGVRGR